LFIFRILKKTLGSGCVNKRTIEGVLQENNPRLMAMSGVQWTAQGVDSEGRSCIVVRVSKKDKVLPRELLKEIDGYNILTMEAD
jgi:hypothetical protein